MATVPMMTEPTEANADHRVTAPGGYEWWHFDAVDEQQDLVVVASLHSGYDWDGWYARAYRRYRRWPTLFRPPAPADFALARLAVYRGGRRIGGFDTRGKFTASADRMDVRVGEMRAYAEGSAARVTAAGVDLSFAPLADAANAVWPLDPPQHCWIVAGAWRKMNGTLRAGGETINVEGLGYHDHMYGTAPLPFTHLRRGRRLGAKGARVILWMKRGDWKRFIVLDENARAVAEMTADDPPQGRVLERSERYVLKQDDNGFLWEEWMPITS